MTLPRRIYSIDVFRGITIAFMIVVNNPGTWSSVYSPLLHAKWHGCTITDLVFPFFMFIVGASMRFAFVRWHNFASKKFFKHVIFRSLSIFLAGWFIHSFPFIRQDWDWSTFRYMGVLQRISIAYFFSSLIVIRYNFKEILATIFSILFLYWGLIWLGGSGDPYSLETNFVRKIDILFFSESHLWTGTGIPFDPEGLLSTLPSIATVLIGYLIGGMLHTTKKYSDCIKRMTVFGFVSIILGLVWGLIFPINKALWTSSYVLYTGGIASVFLALLTYLIDIKKYKKPFWPFEVFGTNSIFLFVLSGIWAKTILKIKLDYNGTLISAHSYFYKTVFEPMAGEYNGSLFFALTHVICFWLILFWMDKKNIQVKL